MEDEPPEGQSASKEELIEAIREIDGPAFTAPEIADSLGIGVDSARQYLYELVDSDLLSMKKPGSRTVIFWLSESQQSEVSEA
ncbi:hypothetical protein C471_08440 [Halorubrum saccharovorum DSM 1137]|uniref:Uncharacterized protein n=1 Tax=Halorubrum saccharovorum DSM 1137 TaxID=1227484 RepID=M0DX81_9EURY|nr:FaeA/PapI family transcriptional regulator [Halorubrum saccharovorum]ELZ39332.1 hypothetical protein C471_08440 [Halorubrum saccharovorum DSM 1137]